MPGCQGRKSQWRSRGSRPKLNSKQKKEDAAKRRKEHNKNKTKDNPKAFTEPLPGTRRDRIKNKKGQ